MPEMLRFKVPGLVGDVFFKFGVLLLNDTTGQKMTVIKQDCGDDYSHIVRMTLKKWIKGEGLPVKWKTLVKTLRDCDLISLAAEIEAKKINGNILQVEKLSRQANHILWWSLMQYVTMHMPGRCMYAKGTCLSFN